MPTGSDREGVGQVWCRKHWRGRHVCGARGCKRVDSGDIIKLSSKDSFSRQPSGPNITRFVSVLAKRPRALPPVPLSLPADDDWLLKIIAIQDRFVLGLYRRQMKTISYLGKIEKHLGVPVTTRNWNTIEKVAKILQQGG